MIFEHNPLSDDEQDYVKEAHVNTTVPEMAAHLKRGASTVYAWMKERDLKPYRRGKTPAYTHPLRAQNRRLEATLKHWDIVNGKNGPV